MSSNLSQATITELLSGYLDKLPEKKQQLFFSKLISNNTVNLDMLIQFIKSPDTYKFEKDNIYVSIGDTVYVDVNHLWTTQENELQQNGKAIDGILRPATVVDIQFFPEAKLIVTFHDEGATATPTDIHNHYLIALDFV